MSFNKALYQLFNYNSKVCKEFNNTYNNKIDIERKKLAAFYFMLPHNIPKIN